MSIDFLCMNKVKLEKLFPHLADLNFHPSFSRSISRNPPLGGNLDEKIVQGQKRFWSLTLAVLLALSLAIPVGIAWAEENAPAPSAAGPTQAAGEQTPTPSEPTPEPSAPAPADGDEAPAETTEAPTATPTPTPEPRQQRRTPRRRPPRRRRSQPRRPHPL